MEEIHVDLYHHIISVIETRVVSFFFSLSGAMQITCKAEVLEGRSEATTLV